MADFAPLRFLQSLYPQDVNAAQPEAYATSVRDPLAKLALNTGMSMYRGALAPGKIYASNEPLSSEQMIGPAQDIMSLMRSGVGAAQRGAVGTFGGKSISSEEPAIAESIVGPAVKYKGEFYTGKNHDDAAANVARTHGFPFRSTVDRNLLIDALQDTEGFLTNTGRYVSRQEAGEIADRAQQLKKPLVGPMSTVDLRKDPSGKIVPGVNPQP